VGYDFNAVSFAMRCEDSRDSRCHRTASHKGEAIQDDHSVFALKVIIVPSIGAPRRSIEGGHMKPEFIIGVILVALASIVFRYQDFSHTMWGNLNATMELAADKTNTIPLDPVFTQLALAGGIVLVVIGLKESFSARSKTKPK
jgi:hypothetical protein